jgi:hypothetical protein
LSVASSLQDFSAASAEKLNRQMYAEDAEESFKMQIQTYANFTIHTYEGL